MTAHMTAQVYVIPITLFLTLYAIRTCELFAAIRKGKLGLVQLTDVEVAFMAFSGFVLFFCMLVLGIAFVNIQQADLFAPVSAKKHFLAGFCACGIIGALLGVVTWKVVTDLRTFFSIPEPNIY